MSEERARWDSSITVTIIGGDGPARERLRLLIDRSPGIRCRSGFATVEEALRSAIPSAPDILLLDVQLPAPDATAGPPVYERPRPARPRELTARELRLLRLLAEGCTYSAAAAALHVSVNTIRNYIRSVYDKLHVHSKSAAVSKALRTGILV